MGKDTCHYFQPFLKVCSKLSFISVSFQKEFDKPVLVCLNFCIKIIPLGSLWTTEIYFSRFQRLKSPRSALQQMWFLLRALSLAFSHFLSSFFLLCKDSDPILETIPSWPHLNFTFQRHHLLTPSHWWFRLNTWISGTHTFSP